MCYLDWVGKVFPGVRIDADFVEYMSKSVNNRFEFDKLSEQPIFVPKHHPFLTSRHGLNAIDKTTMGFSHAE